MNALNYKPTYRRTLPHIQPPGAAFFVTFRLAGSIPTAVLHQWREETDRTQRTIAAIPDPAERARQTYLAQRRAFGRWDALLDRQTGGPHWLRQPEIAQIVADSLHFLDKQRYDLDSYTIMSNHVHVIFTPLSQRDETYHALQAISSPAKRRWRSCWRC